MRTETTRLFKDLLFLQGHVARVERLPARGTGRGRRLPCLLFQGPQRGIDPDMPVEKNSGPGERGQEDRQGQHEDQKLDPGFHRAPR